MGLFHSDDGYVSPFDASETVDSADDDKISDNISDDKPYYVPKTPKTEHAFHTAKTRKTRNAKTESHISTLFPPSNTRSETTFRGIGIAVLIMVIFALIVTVISRSNMYASKRSIYSPVTNTEEVILEPASDDMPNGEQTGTLRPGTDGETDISILDAYFGPKIPCGATLRIRYKIRAKGSRSAYISGSNLGVFQDGKELLPMNMRYPEQPSQLMVMSEIPASTTMALTVTYVPRNTVSGVDVTVREYNGTIRAKSAFMFTDNTLSGAALRRVAHSSLPKPPTANPSDLKKPVTVIARDRKYTFSVESLTHEYVRGRSLATMTIHWFVEWTDQPCDFSDLYPTLFQNGKELYRDRYAKQKDPSVVYSDSLRVYPNLMMSTTLEFELVDLSAPVRLRVAKSFDEPLWEGDFEHHLRMDSAEDTPHTV